MVEGWSDDGILMQLWDDTDSSEERRSKVEF